MLRSLDTMMKRLLFGGGILLLLIVLFGFSRRIAEFSRLNGQLEREAARITELAATQEYLQDRIAYANSEAAVEEWARQDARWARQGDFPVIPLVPPDYTPEPPSEEEAQTSATSNFDAWWDWFFFGGP
jgi:cell division protein FtsB